MPPTVLPHHQDVATVVLGREEDLWHDDEDFALAGRVDGPDAVHVSRIISWVVRRLDVANIFSDFAATFPVCANTRARDPVRGAADRLLV